MSKVGKGTAGEGLTYKASGVDIDKGADFVRAIAPMAGSTDRAGVVSGIGGFGGFFDPSAAGYKDPLLVAATDGVGTKLKIAIETGLHGTVGIDLVAMCVNDLVVQGAEPLFFLDYFATGALDNAAAEQVLSGIAAGCREAGCALIGGETAEMPGMYRTGDYDLAGFAVGAVERGAALPRTDVAIGDVVLGIVSSGLHSNGFSLVRKVVEAAGLNFSDKAPFGDDASLGAALLTPTRIYVKSCLAAVRTGKVKALAHITGGGLLDNIPRVLPDGIGADLDANAWRAPEVFDWLAETGAIAGSEMAHAFNCGIGMTVITAPGDATEIAALLTAEGENVTQIGTVVARGPGEPEIKISGLEEKWRG